MPPITGADYPTGKFRGRIISIAGAAPNPAHGYAFNIDGPGSSLFLNPISGSISNGLPPYTAPAGVEVPNATGGNWSANYITGLWEVWNASDNTYMNARYPNNPWNSSFGKWPAIFVFRVRYNLTADPVVVEWEVEFDETPGVIHTLTGTLTRHAYSSTYAPSGSNDSVGLIGCIYRDGGGLPQIKTLREWMEDEYWTPLALEDEVVNKPSRFLMLDFYIGKDDDLGNWNAAADALIRQGINGLNLPNRKNIIEALVPAKFPHFGIGAFRPAANDVVSYGFATGSIYSSFGNSYGAGIAGSGLSDRFKWMVISDEPTWYMTAHMTRLAADATALARFRAYLQAQSPALTPADLGFATWADVVPGNRSTLAASTLTLNRLYYWTVRFISQDSGEHDALSTAGLRAVTPTVKTAVNWNTYLGRLTAPGRTGPNPSPTGDLMSALDNDYFEFARQNPGAFLWRQDWFGDGDAYKWSFTGSMMRDAARYGGIPWGGYIVPRSSGSRRWGMKTKILAAVAYGAKAFLYYTFGPEMLFEGSCYSDEADTPHMLRRIGETLETVGTWEDELYDSTPYRSTIGFVYPVSSQLYDIPLGEAALPGSGYRIQDATNSEYQTNTTDYFMDVFYVWLALMHAGYPVEWIHEDQLDEPGYLDRFSCIYCSAPSLPAEALTALRDWVFNGGVLATSPTAGQRDRYFQPSAIWTSAFGFSENDPANRVIESSGGQALAGTSTLDGVSTNLYGHRPTVTGSVGTVEATWNDDSSPAAFRITYHFGQVFHFAFFPGLAYQRNQSGTTDQLKTGWPEKLRNLIVKPVELAGYVPPVTVDADLVEAVTNITPSGGCVITLLNWTGTTIPVLSLICRPGIRIGSVESDEHGPLGFTQVGTGQVSLTLPLNYADVLILTPAGEGSTTFEPSITTDQDEADVEVIWQFTVGGATATLINHTGGPLSNLLVTAHLGLHIVSAVSLDLGNLSIVEIGGLTEIRLSSLDASDVLTLTSAVSTTARRRVRAGGGQRR